MYFILSLATIDFLGSFSIKMFGMDGPVSARISSSSRKEEKKT